MSQIASKNVVTWRIAILYLSPQEVSVICQCAAKDIMGQAGIGIKKGPTKMTGRKKVILYVMQSNIV